MSEISSRQMYDLLLEISRDVAQLEGSIDERLIDMRTLNRDMHDGRFFEPSQNSSGTFCR